MEMEIEKVTDKKQKDYGYAPMQIDADLHTQIKVNASMEGLTIKDFIGKIFAHYQTTTHQ